MRWALLARAERRGLGNLSAEIARNMKPDKVLIVRPRAAVEAELAWHKEWFDPATRGTIQWNGYHLDERPMRKWLAGLDALLMLETPYDFQIIEWAREAGCATVLWLMAEYDRLVRHPELPRPTATWAPTSWRLDHLIPGTEIVPVPVALDRFPPRPPSPESRVVRWLHVAGARAASDRNGTLIVLEALKHLRGEHAVTIRSQGHPFARNGSIGRNVHLEVHATEVAEYPRLYDDADALIFPRRYGGLTLVAHEAMAAGLALVMPDVSPNDEWPIVPLAATFENSITTSAGCIPIAAVDPRELAERMDWISAHRGVLTTAQQRSREWAEANSWAALEPTIRAALERACA